MARGITENDVHTAADALLATGERPTVDRIRAHLGTGSPNTVTRWLETWWQGLAARVSAQQRRLTLPEAPATVTALAAQWWEQAIAAARDEAAQALADERQALARERDDLAEQATVWDEQIRVHAAVAEHARQLLSVAEQRQADLLQLCEQQAGQIADLAAQRTALRERADRLEADLAALQGRWEARETALSAERESQRQQLQAIEDRAHAEIDRARQETKAVRADLSAQLRGQEAELRITRERERVAGQALGEAKQEAAAQRARAETLFGQLKGQTVKSPRRAAPKKSARLAAVRRPSKST